MHLKESKECYMERFRGRNGRGETGFYDNLKNKKVRKSPLSQCWLPCSIFFSFFFSSSGLFLIEVKTRNFPTFNTRCFFPIHLLHDLTCKSCSYISFYKNTLAKCNLVSVPSAAWPLSLVMSHGPFSISEWPLRYNSLKAKHTSYFSCLWKKKTCRDVDFLLK